MNQPKTATATSSTTPATTVEEGTQFKGALTSTCPVVVRGAIEGDVEAPAVTVSATGALSGTVVSGALKSAGRIAGTLDVDTAEIAGSVAKNTVLRASALDVKLSLPNGKVQLTFGTSDKKS